MGWRGPLTHRQFVAWQAWLDADLERPSRTDHYLMQLAAGLEALPSLVWGKEPPQRPLWDYRIRYRQEPGEEDSGLSAEEATEAAKLRLSLMTGVPVSKMKFRPPPGVWEDDDGD